MAALLTQPVVSFPEAERLVASVPWFHRFELVEGLVTPGHVFTDAARYIDSLHLGDVAGLRILEIGTWDGPLSFELKQRGASVVATDIQDPSHTGFKVVELVSGLSVPYVRESVYNIHKHFYDEFDIVLFFGVFYHLKYPNLAFESIAKVLKLGGTLFTEGRGLGPYLEDVDGVSIAPPEGTWEMLETLDAMGVPLSLAYPGTFIGGCNWYLANKSALRGWMVAAGFDVDALWSQTGGGQGEIRIGSTGTKAREPEIEHGLTGEVGGFSLI